MKDHRLIDERSLAFHRAVAEKLRAQPARLGQAKANLERWAAGASPRVRPVFAEWHSLLDGPFDRLLAILTADEPRAARLRQSSPFAGLLTPSERFAILREFQAHDPLAA